MFPESILPPSLYHTVYNLLIIILCLATIIVYSLSNKNKFCYSGGGFILEYGGYLLVSILTLFLGLRPVSLVFVDTQLYADLYVIISGYQSVGLNNEWLWHNLTYFCKTNGFTVNEYFLLIEVVYMGSCLVACYKLTRNNIWLSILFCLSSFSFYSYGINGIRNGMACHLVLLGIAFVFDKKYYSYIIAAVAFIFAYAIHRSAMLPVLCFFASFLIKEPKTTITIWFVSILISLIAGNAIGDLFQTLGIFEDKLSYFQDVEETGLSESFSQTGFRFDFLIYGAMPVLMAWYLTVKRNFNDKVFNLLANTYILANAFWIIIIRASYSNRFAYLSWFLYPIIIVYPLVRMNVWDSQDRKAAVILLLYSGFTFFMNFIYYA